LDIEDHDFGPQVVNCGQRFVRVLRLFDNFSPSTAESISTNRSRGLAESSTTSTVFEFAVIFDYPRHSLSILQGEPPTPSRPECAMAGSKERRLSRIARRLVQPERAAQSTFEVQPKRLSALLVLCILFDLLLQILG
jgi:hypothetical protein